MRLLVATVIAAGTIGVGVAGQKTPLLSPASLNLRAPALFRSRFDTSKGTFVVEVHRDWAPRGSDRFYSLVKAGFYDNCRFFRVIDSVVAQAGIHGDPAVQAAWASAVIADDPPAESDRRGTIALASAGPHSRSTQFYINLADNSRSFARQNAAPFGRVVAGMDVVDSLYSGYGEGAPRGTGPDQTRIREDGNAYLTKSFPKLDYVKKAAIEN